MIFAINPCDILLDFNNAYEMITVKTLYDINIFNNGI